MGNSARVPVTKQRTAPRSGAYRGVGDSGKCVSSFIRFSRLRKRGSRPSALWKTDRLLRDTGRRWMTRVRQLESFGPAARFIEPARATTFGYTAGSMRKTG